jgi:hypothetical protein
MSKRVIRFHVTDYDDSSISLKGEFGSGASIRIGRDALAGVMRRNNAFYVETTGGATYFVMRGLRSAQRRMSDEAFREWLA